MEVISISLVRCAHFRIYRVNHSERNSISTRAHVSFSMYEISPANAVEVDCVVFDGLAISRTVNNFFVTLLGHEFACTQDYSTVPLYWR